MGKDNDKRNRRNRENAKQSTQTVIASPISTSTAGVLMETGTWPAKEYLQYSIMILYHSIINSG